MTDRPILDIRGLSVGYATVDGPLMALRNVSLSLAPGEAIGVVGESGSGKSTLVGAVLDLLGPGAEVHAGEIDFDGQDLRALPAPERRRLLGSRIASVFQDPFTSLNPSMRIGDQIAEPLIEHLGFARDAAHDRARELLAELGIARTADVASAYPHQLSGGMKQRALIAAALTCEPSLIILDEPTTALDVTIEAQILDLLASLRRRHNLSLIFISHNLAVVRRVCDSVSVLYAGEVMEHGPVERLFSVPSHPYAKGLLASLPRIGLGDARERLTPIPGSLPNLVDVPQGCSFADRCAFVEPTCRTQPQAMVEVASGVRARCWKVGQLVDRPWPRDPGASRPAGTVVTGEELVRVTDLSKRFRVGSFWDRLHLERDDDGRLGLAPQRRVTAVDRVNLEIRRGEILGLVGESGCGKTTLGRCVVRLIDPSGGHLTFDGADVTTAGRGALRGFRRDAQIIFQNPDSSLNPRMTVAEIVARPLRLFGLASGSGVAARVSELLAMVRLPTAFAQRYPHQLSGGEKQRVGIARALASGPRFIVCDEAVSALDVSVQAAIVNLLADLRAELGLTLLFISHDISVVAHLADRIAVMYQGRICEIGATRDVLHPPYHPYTQALLSAAPQIEQQGAARGRIALTGEVGEPGANAQHCPFHPRCPMKIGSVCETAEPALSTLAPGHRIACHHGPQTLRAMASVIAERDDGRHDGSGRETAGSVI